MKHNICSSPFLFVFVFLLLSSSASSARPVETLKSAAESIKHRGHPDSLEETEELGSEFMSLMGLNVCKDGEEECLRRRAVSEAHLDYIYTQHHKH